MNNRLKRKYEIFNTQTGEWEKKLMTDEEFELFKEKMTTSHEEMEAEYDIISKIVAQKLGYDKNTKSMD